MAKMIPNEVENSDFHGSFGEIEVYEALKGLPDEYIVFHSVNWKKRNKYGRIEWGESDFTVLHPKRGFLVIEVKSGGIECENGKWTQINTLNNERYKMKDPMAQASRSKFTFIELLSDSMKIANPYWVEVCVWFPSVSRQSEIGNLPPSYTNETVFFEEDLKNPKKAIERAFDYYNMNENNRYNSSDLNETIRVISPNFNAIQSLTSSIKEEKHFFNKMTTEQSYLLDYLEEQRVAAIQGAAGTGKSLMAIEKAKRLSLDEKVLFLCFNKLLLDFFRENFSEDYPNIEFHNLHSLIYQQESVYDVDDERISIFLNKNLDGWVFKHIIIDEGQDFSEDHLELLSTIAEIQDGSFYVFFDKNQLVQKRHEMAWVNNIECRLVLTANCRNTLKIATTSFKPIGIDKIKMRYEVPGTKPNFHIIKNKETVVEYITSLIRAFTEKGFKKEQIVILTVKTEGDSILNGTTNLGSYRIVKSRNEKGILFTSSRKFKGLESDIVILVDVDDINFNNEEAKKIFYVGASRAKHLLEIISLVSEEQLSNIVYGLSSERSKQVKLMLGKYLEVKLCNG
jgi:hypothetical protein